MDYPEIVERFEAELESDPFGASMAIFKEVLEFVLDDGQSGKMSDKEYLILTDLARRVSQDGGMEVNPRVG